MPRSLKEFNFLIIMINLINGRKVFIIFIISVFIIAGLYYVFNKKEISQWGSSEKIQEDNLSDSSECVNYVNAKNYIGEHTCIEGKIDHIYISSKGNIFLDFCPDYRNCPFSAVIFKSYSYKFPDIKKYENKVVQIEGLVKTYKGRPEIVINDPNQIKIK